MELKTTERLAKLRRRPNREYIKSFAWLLGQFWPDYEQVPEEDEFKQDIDTFTAHIGMMPSEWRDELNKELDRLCTKRAGFFVEEFIESGEAKKNMDGVKRRFGLI